MTAFTQLLQDLPEALPVILAHDVLRYILGASGVFLTVNTLFSPLLRGRRIRERNISGAQIRREILTSLRTALVFSCVGLSIWAGTSLGWLRFYEDPAQYGWLWFAASIILLIVLHDTWFYWTHRLIHDPRLFRRLHRTHHKSHNPTPFAAYAFDTGEAVINGVYMLVAGLVMPVSFAAMFVFTAYMMLMNAIGHSGYELYPRTRRGKPLFDWYTTVTHHDLHHAEARWNYGLYFTHWDRWMGTEHPDYHARFAASVRQPAQGKTSAKPVNALLLALAALSLLSLNGPDAQAQAPDHPAALQSVRGDWATQGYGAVVRLAPCQTEPDELCGTLIWAWEPDKLKPGVIGTEILSGLNYSNEIWRDGRLKNPEDGRTYKGSLQQISHDTLRLEGCASIFCQRETWRRLESLPHVQGFE